MLSLLVSIFALCLSKLDFSEDISDFLPVGDDYSTVNSFVSEASGNSKIMVFFTANDSIFDPDRIASCMDKYASNLVDNDRDGFFDGFNAGYDESKIFALSGFIQQNIPLFVDEADYLHADSLLTVRHAVDALSTDKKLLFAPVPSYVKNAVKVDPLGLFVHKLNGLRDFRPAECYSFINGHAFEPEMRRGVIFFDSPTGMSESDVNGKIVDRLTENAATIADEYPEISVSLFGAPVIAVCNSRQIKHDTVLTTLLSIVLIAVILWFSIRNVGNLFWMTFTLIFGFMAAGAAAWLFFGKISLIALGISSVFTGIAINYPLHFITHLYHSGDIRQNMREIVSPLVTGNVTTVAAFFSLMFAGSKALRDLGFVGGILLIASILFTLIFLPHFVRKVDVDGKGNIFKNFDFSFDFLRKKCFVIPVLVVTPVLVYFGFKTEFDSNLHNINYMDEPLSKEAAHTFTLLNSDTAVSVFVTAVGVDFESALLRHESASAGIDSLIDKRLIIKKSGVGEYLPSLSRQCMKIDRWNDYMASRRDSIKNLLAVGLDSAKLRADLFAPFNELIDKDFAPLDTAAFSPLIHDALSGYVHADGGRVAVVTILKVRPDDAAEVVSTIQNCCGDVVVYDERIVSQSFMEMLNDNFNFVLFAAGFIVFVFLTVSFGRLELSLISFVPLTVSWFWILGLMYLFDFKFNIVNIILATFIFGQGDDYAVFMTEGLMYEYARGKRVLKSFKNSVAISSLIMFVGIGSLIFSKHPAMSSLGVVVVIGMFSVVAASFIFPPLLFDWLIKKRDGSLRHAPYTLKRMVFSCVYFMVFVTACFVLYIRSLFMTNKISDKKKFHRFMQCIARMTHFIPGVPFKVENPFGFDFTTPSIIIANHSSSFDVLCLMTLHPDLLFVTNDSQQNNPFYGKVIKNADFYPVSLGYGVLSERLKPFVDSGFSVVVFPEGTRSTDGKIHRFHQGAFFLAKSLGLPVTPVFIHGAGHVYPKRELFIREGSITIRVHKIIQQPDSELFADNILETSRNFRHYFMDLYSSFAREVEAVDYLKKLILSNYLYKGADVYLSVRKGLDNYKQSVENIEVCDCVIFNNCRYGEVPFLYALLNRNVSVVGVDDEEYVEVARLCKDLPGNLEFRVKKS